MLYPKEFDVIVVGGGHAGTEAALAAARMGCATLLLTHNIETLGQMSCNPSIGGIGKGHLVKEVDALGGAMAAATDEAGIQFRILNGSKGPAVRATRAQADRILYKAAIRRRLENQPNLWLFQQAVDDLRVEGDRVTGVVTQVGIRFAAQAVVLTVGTFLDGRIHVGLQNHSAGRAGDPPALSLSARLKELKLPQGRLKTGTPPRIDGRSIDFSRLAEQAGDLDPVPVFSFLGDASQHPRQVPCWITHTNEHTHEIIRSGLDRSPMFTGVIEGVGPRYCPSIEDKVNRFADKTLAPDLPRARRADDARVLSERHLDLTAVRRATRCRALDSGLGAGAHPAAGLRDRVRLLRSAGTAGELRDAFDRRAVLRRADQRHHRLRRSCGAGAVRRPQRRTAGAWSATRGRPGATRRTSACSSTT